jgi:hypothetical protein
MAGTYYGVQYDLAYNTDPPEFTHASWQGKTLTMMDTQESLTATGLDAGSTFYMFRPPKGARWNGIGKVWSDALANNTTLSVGTSITAAGVAADVDRFGAATSHTAAAQTDLGLAADIDQVGYEFDGVTDVTITTGTGAMTTARTVTLMMQFVVA